MVARSQSVATLAVLVALSALLLSSDVARGSHYVYEVDNPAPGFNPNGMQSDYGTVWGGNKGWITAGQIFGICNDWNVYDYNAMPQGVRDAVAAWEAVLGNGQFSSACGLTGYGLNFSRSTVTLTPAYPCGAVPHGCTRIDPYKEYDSLRKAWYPTTTDVWFNTQHAFSETGYGAVAAHELGHVFGLDEQYNEPVSCSSIASVMNIATGTGACDPNGPQPPPPIGLPNGTDVSRVQSFFYPMPVGPHIVSQGGAPGVLYLNFTDLSYVESGYQIYIDRKIGGSWTPITQWLHAASVGKRNVVNGIPWYRGSNPPGIYRMCGFTYNTLSGYMHYFCADEHYVS